MSQLYRVTTFHYSKAFRFTMIRLIISLALHETFRMICIFYWWTIQLFIFSRHPENKLVEMSVSSSVCAHFSSRALSLTIENSILCGTWSVMSFAQGTVFVFLTLHKGEEHQLTRWPYLTLTLESDWLVCSWGLCFETSWTNECNAVFQCHSHLAVFSFNGRRLFFYFKKTGNFDAPEGQLFSMMM